MVIEILHRIIHFKNIFYFVKKETITIETSSTLTTSWDPLGTCVGYNMYVEPLCSVMPSQGGVSLGCKAGKLLFKHAFLFQCSIKTKSQLIKRWYQSKLPLL